MRGFRLILSAVAASVATLVAAGPQTPPQRPPQTPPASQQTPPRLAVVPFLALTPDKDTEALAETMSDVLFDDLRFEKEFYMIPPDVIRTVPRPRAIDNPQYDRWREIGADGVVFGTVRKTERGLAVQVRMFSVRSKESAFGKEYSGTAANQRLYAHTMADEIHMQQRRLRGVARTKLTFSSDRD